MTSSDEVAQQIDRQLAPRDALCEVSAEHSIFVVFGRPPDGDHHLSLCQLATPTMAALTCGSQPGALPPAWGGARSPSICLPFVCHPTSLGSFSTPCACVHRHAWLHVRRQGPPRSFDPAHISFLAAPALPSCRPASCLSVSHPLSVSCLFCILFSILPISTPLGAQPRPVLHPWHNKPSLHTCASTLLILHQSLV